MKICVFLFWLLITMVAVAAVPELASGDLTANQADTDHLELRDLTIDDTSVNPAGPGLFDSARKNPCKRKCITNKDCCKRDQCFMDACIGPHRDRRELLEIMQREINNEPTPLEPTDKKCKRRCWHHRQCCRTDICMHYTCMGKHEDHPMVSEDEEGELEGSVELAEATE